MTHILMTDLIKQVLRKSQHRQMTYQGSANSACSVLWYVSFLVYVNNFSSVHISIHLSPYQLWLFEFSIFYLISSFFLLQKLKNPMNVTVEIEKSSFQQQKQESPHRLPCIKLNMSIISLKDGFHVSLQHLRWCSQG